MWVELRTKILYGFFSLTSFELIVFLYLEPGKPFSKETKVVGFSLTSFEWRDQSSLGMWNHHHFMELNQKPKYWEMSDWKQYLLDIWHCIQFNINKQSLYKKTVSARSRGFHLVFKQGLFHFKWSKDQKRSKSLICDQLTSSYSWVDLFLPSTLGLLDDTRFFLSTRFEKNWPHSLGQSTTD